MPRSAEPHSSLSALSRPRHLIPRPRTCGCPLGGGACRSTFAPGAGGPGKRGISGASARPRRPACVTLRVLVVVQTLLLLASLFAPIPVAAADPADPEADAGPHRARGDARTGPDGGARTPRPPRIPRDARAGPHGGTRPDGRHLTPRPRPTPTRQRSRTRRPTPRRSRPDRPNRRSSPAPIRAPPRPPRRARRPRTSSPSSPAPLRRRGRARSPRRAPTSSTRSRRCAWRVIAVPAGSSVVADLRADPSVASVEATASATPRRCPNDPRYRGPVGAADTIGWDHGLRLGLAVRVRRRRRARHGRRRRPRPTSPASSSPAPRSSTAPPARPTRTATAPAMAGIIAAATDNGIGHRRRRVRGRPRDARDRPRRRRPRPGQRHHRGRRLGGRPRRRRHQHVASAIPATRRALQAAIDYAWDHDVVVVAATGNDGSSSAHVPGRRPRRHRRLRHRPFRHARAVVQRRRRTCSLPPPGWTS